MQIQPSPTFALASQNGPVRDSLAKIKKAATDFEAILLAQMLKTARSDVSDDQQNSTMLELGEQQFAQSMANNGGLGIAKMVVAGLTKNADR